MTYEERVIPGLEAYSVSSEGDVISNARISFSGRRLSRRIMRLQDLPNGHKQVSLTVEGVSKSYTVHSLVARAFLPPKPTPGWYEIRHLNGNPADNRAVNLRWGTRSENQQDSLRHGTHAQAAKTHCSRGHEYSGLNLRITSTGSRLCVSCTRARSRARDRGEEINPREADAIYQGLGDEARLQEARLDALKTLVEEGVSINEIMRTLRMSHETIHRHHPGYRPFPPGATPESNMIREANRKLREIEQSGRVQSDRDSGFNLRSRMG